MFFRRCYASSQDVGRFLEEAVYPDGVQVAPEEFRWRADARRDSAVIDDLLDGLRAVWLVICEWFWAIIDELIRDYGS